MNPKLLTSRWTLWGAIVAVVALTLALLVANGPLVTSGFQGEQQGKFDVPGSKQVQLPAKELYISYGYFRDKPHTIPNDVQVSIKPADDVPTPVLTPDRSYTSKRLVTGDRSLDRVKITHAGLYTVSVTGSFPPTEILDSVAIGTYEPKGQLIRLLIGAFLLAVVIGGWLLARQYLGRRAMYGGAAF